MAEKVRLDDKTHFQRDRFSSWKTVAFIVTLLMVWAAILSAGALLNGSQDNNSNNLGRSIFIFSALAIFCTGWTIALAIRNKNQSKGAE